MKLQDLCECQQKLKVRIVTHRNTLHEEDDPGKSAKGEFGLASFTSDGHNRSHDVSVKDGVVEEHAEDCGERNVRRLQKGRAEADEDVNSHDNRENAHVRPHDATVVVNIALSVGKECRELSC